jgi:hypothetical protein
MPETSIDVQDTRAADKVVPHPKHESVLISAIFGLGLARPAKEAVTDVAGLVVASPAVGPRALQVKVVRCVVSAVNGAAPGIGADIPPIGIDVRIRVAVPERET